MKVAYVSTYDARDIRSWSGIGYYMADALRGASLELECIGPLGRLAAVPFRAFASVGRVALHKEYLYDRQPSYLRAVARQAARRIRSSGVDAVFSPGTVPIAHLDVGEPLAFWTDATFAGMVDFYPRMSRLLSRSVHQGNAMEARALERSHVAIYSSEWAASSAVEDYGADPARVHVVPFGANLRAPGAAEVRVLVENRPSDRCDLLFVAAEWHRKGGEEALRIVEGLNQRGLDATLTIIGDGPPGRRVLPRYVRALGFLDKATPSGRAALAEWLGRSHFLVLPTFADATPIVICEAGAFGVPVLSTRVGGIPSVVVEAKNGFLFPPPPVDVAQWCDAVLDVLSSDDYSKLALASRAEYERRLNWSVAGRAAADLLRSSHAH